MTPFHTFPKKKSASRDVPIRKLGNPIVFTSFLRTFRGDLDIAGTSETDEFVLFLLFSIHNITSHFTSYLSLKMTKTLRTFFNPQTFLNIYEIIIIVLRNHVKHDNRHLTEESCHTHNKSFHFRPFFFK